MRSLSRVTSYWYGALSATICKIQNDGIKFADRLHAGADRSDGALCPFIGVSSATGTFYHAAGRARRPSRGPRWVVSRTARLIRHCPPPHQFRYQHNIVLVPTSGASRRRCCQFIRLTQSQRSAGATAADATAASSSTRVGTRDALRNGRAYLRWFHFYAATKPMRHIAVHATARSTRERAFDYMARTWSSHSS